MLALHEKCPRSDICLVRILHIWPKYGHLQSISWCLDKMRENTDHKKTPNLETFHTVWKILKQQVTLV